MRSLLVLLFSGVAATLAAQDAAVPPGPMDAPPGDRFNPGQLRSTLVVPRTKIERFRPSRRHPQPRLRGDEPAIADWVALMDRIGVRERSS